MTILELEYRFLVRRAIKHKDFKLAAELKDWAQRKHGLDIPLSKD